MLEFSALYDFCPIRRIFQVPTFILVINFYRFMGLFVS